MQKGEHKFYIPKLEVNANQEVYLRLFADDVSISKEEPKSISIRNIIKSRVISIKPESTSFLLISLEVDEEIIFSRITRKAQEELGLSVGMEVFALIKSVVIDKAN